MDDLHCLMIERACLRLMTDYCTHLDNRDVDAFLALYLPEASWRRVGQEPIIDLAGPVAIRGFIDRLSKATVSRHLVINPVVTVVDADNAMGVCMGMVVRGPAGKLPVPMRGLELLVEYRDIYKRTAAGWRIALREMTRLIDSDATLAGG